MYACLAVTCHLHFWQNDRDLLRATVVTRGWNGYRNKSQHRKSTPEKKILPPFQQGFEPATFQSRVRRSNHWAIPAPYLITNWPYRSYNHTDWTRNNLPDNLTAWCIVYWSMQDFRAGKKSCLFPQTVSYLKMFERWCQPQCEFLSALSGVSATKVMKGKLYFHWCLVVEIFH